MPEYILTLRCPDTAGIVHAVSAGLLASGSNILEQAQFTDPELGVFCLRTRFESPVDAVDDVRAALDAELARFSPDLSLRRRDAHRRVLVMVSRFDHCLADLLYRRALGELHVDVPVVVSNHEDCRALVESYGVPFVHVPVTAGTKPAAEQRLRDLVREHDVDVVVLARYMQVLSDAFCADMPGRIVNIHHSFLPGFKGARPYHQAHERGVKLIGATCHYATGELDAGPIIDQEVIRVEHFHTPDDLVRLGRDCERLALARSVRWHLDDRVLIHGNKSIVFRD